jgi:hypothetical protein
MARATGVTKRPPELDFELRGRYKKISKADWADLYADLFRQVYGEDADDQDIMQDAEERLVILTAYREAL